ARAPVEPGRHERDEYNDGDGRVPRDRSVQRRRGHGDAERHAADDVQGGHHDGSQSPTEHAPILTGPPAPCGITHTASHGSVCACLPITHDAAPPYVPRCAPGGCPRCWSRI